VLVFCVGEIGDIIEFLHIKNRGSGIICPTRVSIRKQRSKN